MRSFNLICCRLLRANPRHPARSTRVRFYPALLALIALIPGALVRGADDYKLGPDSERQNVPHGEVRQATFTTSKVFPGTTRDYFVYVPKQYDPAKPACLMV